LLEVSFVPVPCNPNALSLGKEIVEDLISKGLLIKEETNEQESEELHMMKNHEQKMRKMQQMKELLICERKKTKQKCTLNPKETKKKPFH
jgi:coenzyme F420-reducing hydrogenase beta subunit